MKNLPIELCAAVVVRISSAADLLLLRSVNHIFHQLVTPYLFRRIHIQNSARSAQNCRRILASPSLAVHVFDVVYDQRDNARFYLPARIMGTQDVCDGFDLEELEEALLETFWELPSFVNLKSVVLNFWPSFLCQHGTEIRENPLWFSNRQITVLRGIHYAMESSRVRSLTLNNVLLIPSANYGFVKSARNSSLHNLSISVVANSDLVAWSDSQVLNGSLGLLLPTPTATLKSLVLRSPRGLYHSLCPQFPSFVYSALETLVLENIAFDPVPSAGGIEEFIIHHKRSLRRLELCGCSSYVLNVTTPVRTWSTIRNRFEQELDALSELVISDFHRAYTLLEGARGFVPHPSPPADLAQG